MVNLSTYLKSLLHLANQPGQFQIKGGANSKFRIEQKPYIKNIKKCSELIIYDSWNFTTIKHLLVHIWVYKVYIWSSESIFKSLWLLPNLLVPIRPCLPSDSPSGRFWIPSLEKNRWFKTVDEWKAAVKDGESEGIKCPNRNKTWFEKKIIGEI